MNTSTYIRRSWVEVDIDKIKKNVLHYCKSNISLSNLMPVVKANAYGHGDLQVTKALATIGIKMFAVSNIEEAIRIRQSGVQSEILILGYTPIEMADELFKYDITQTIVSEEYAELLLAHSSSKIKCQIAIDTGMNRIGIDATKVTECELFIRRCADKFVLNGLFTHLCVADSCLESERLFTKQQIELFKQIVESVTDLDLKYIHYHNSAGGLYYNEHHSIVRLGIVMYGLKPDYYNQLPKGIEPILQWKTVVSMIKTICPGESIGYGRSYVATKYMRIATLTTGYADGYNRLLSNKGYVLIKGKRARIVGRICMDQMMVDISDINDVSIGDEVVLLGNSGNEVITADDMARLIDSIGYEIVCNISSRVPRVYLNE